VFPLSEEFSFAGSKIGYQNRVIQFVHSLHNDDGGNFHQFSWYDQLGLDFWIALIQA
tara:strand:- start:277 stop:447 length:171 start_codon:yes stop_codon:yes gene_type:complete